MRQNKWVMAAALIMFGWESASTARAAVVTAADLDYGISVLQSNAFEGDFSGDTYWTAGSQRSDNGSVDPSNQRSGRLFIDFQLTASAIAAANVPGALVYLTFHVDSIGTGVTGTPYTDGLDMRYFGVSATDRSAATLWDTVGVGTEQSDLLATNGLTGSTSVLITNASVLNDIKTASAGQFVSVGLINSVGTRPPAAPTTPVGNSLAETYGFQMNHTLANYALTVVPEPNSACLLLIGAVSLAFRRRRRIQ